MLAINDVHIVFGRTVDGRKFRPSDWIERISSIAARYDEDRRLRYCPELRPCLINEETTLLISHRLAKTNPQAYAFVMDFIKSNRLQIVSSTDGPANQPEPELQKCA